MEPNDMASSGDIQSEIGRLVEREANGSLPKPWLVAQLVAVHAPRAGDPETLYALHFCYSEYVNRYCRNLKAQEDDEEPSADSLFSEEYRHIQKRYVIQRDGESCIVAVDYMSAEELDAKAAAHKSSAAGHLEHAQELYAFRVKRFGEPGRAA